MGEMTSTSTNQLHGVDEGRREAGDGDQIKSRERVIDLAEVFTHQREVKEMLDFVPDMFESMDSTFLEPACGNGNFLVEILSRKLALIDEAESARTENWPEVGVLRAVASIYAVDICNDNIAEARERLTEVVVRDFAQRGQTPSSGFTSALDVILQANVIRGDTLNGAADIVFYEWSVFDDESFIRTPFPLEPREYDLFDPPPEPLAPVHYAQLGEDK
ncbi:MAG: type III restriction endonuclease subunit M [Acidimicrobiales bacterium]|nr:MAG: type III restriction endonuclease subunit M [Acidimicrobiales bacterium]